MEGLPLFVQNGQDCFLLACGLGHQEIVRELLTRDKVDQNVVDEVRKYPFLCLSLSTVPYLVCVPHLQDGCGAIYLASKGH